MVNLGITWGPVGRTNILTSLFDNFFDETISIKAFSTVSEYFKPIFPKSSSLKEDITYTSQYIKILDKI